MRERKRKVKDPCRDVALMIGPPSCTREAFKKPLLRKCPFDIDTMSWEARLDGGVDGYVWKVKFGDQGPFALKLFWDTEPLDRPLSYHALQRECHNAALLQMIEASVAQATPESPIVVTADPATREEAWINLRAFSTDGRLERESLEKHSVPIKTISQIPRLRKCYGWLNLSSHKLRERPSHMRAPVRTINKIKRFIEADKDYIAIVYEYVEEGENDRAVVKQVLEFLCQAGFSLTISPAERNWKSGVLVDLSDIVSLRGFGWSKEWYGDTDPESILVE